jgi:hypothetical protein
MGVENNLTFGSGTFYIDESKIGTIDTMEVTEYPENQHLKGISFTTAYTAELEGEVNGPLLSELVGPDSDPTFQMEYDGFVYEQVRKHKKRRINKKWAKRYGYREVPCHTVLKNARLVHDREGAFVVVSDCPSIERKRG